MVSSLGNRGIQAAGRGLALSIILGFLLAFSYVVLRSPEVRADSTIDYIQIRSAPGGGGVIIPDKTYYVGDTDVYWAAGYNFTDGYIGDVESHWFSRDPSVGWVNEQGTNTTFHAAGEGHTYVFAYTYNTSGNGTNGKSNETGMLTVLYRGVDYLQIRDGPHGGGTIVDTKNYFVDDTDAFYAAGYNFTDGYLGDLPATWASSNTTVCAVNREGLRADFKALYPGVCLVSAEFNGTVTNETGNLTVDARTVLTVDDSGGADYLTIHEAVENASDGFIIYVFNGTYTEHVNVDKSLIIEGESPDNTFVDGSGSGIVFLVTAKDVNISRFTIMQAEYGIYLDHVNSTKVVHNKITSYTYGIYSNRTHDAFIAWNLITVGKYGIVTDHVNNDAVRWNEISYNTEYGAKDFDSTLRNCFNWNYFHHNHIAYYYDPDEPLTPLTFDGNRIEQNDIGIKAAYASSLIATNNTIVGNGVGIDLTEASPYVARNVLTNNKIGVRFSGSSAQLYWNYIEGGDYGILGSGTSPTIENNNIIGASVAAIQITNGNEVVLRNNDLNGGIARLVDSNVRELSLLRTTAKQVNSTVFDWSLDGVSKIEIQWYMTVRVTDRSGSPISNATVRIHDDGGNEVANSTSGTDGLAGPFELTERVKYFDRTHTLGAYRVEASAGGMSTSESVFVDQNKQLSLALGPVPGIVGGGFPWLFFGIVGFAGVLTVAGLMSVEVFVYFLFALFVPLYTKLRKDQVLDHYSRGRVYQFIELNPGEHFNSIRRALDLNIGTATYHLEVLSRNGLITSRQDGIYKRFYPTNVPIPPSNGGGISEVQQRVLTVIKDTPGIAQKELARLFGIRQSTLNYQVSKLEEKSLIDIRRRGRRVHYFPRESAPPPPPM